MTNTPAALTKVTITAYSSSGFEKDKKIAGGVFTALVNPEGYTRTFKIKYKDQQASGTKAQQMTFDKIEPEDIELEFLFDKTGALPGTFKSKDDAGKENEAKEGIWPDLEQFKKVVYNYKGAIHRPPFLTLEWGSLWFKCVLREMSVTFKLFRPDGVPLRASSKAKFTSTVENELRVRQEDRQSPDITHVRIVKEGDTLPMLAYKIYDNAAYYIEVAKANKLPGFRKPMPNQKLFFPPVKKE
jgi:nucleoid-associated protein YgaU